MVQRFKWELEEILAVLHIGFTYNWASTPPGVEAERISEALRRKKLHPFDATDEKYRNSAGVKRKYQDILSNRPGYPGKPTNGGKLTSEIAEFSVRSPEIAAAVGEAAWRALLKF